MRSSPLSRRREPPSPEDRLSLIAELVAHLTGDAPALTPMEVLRSARLVPGWDLKAQAGRIEVSGGGIKEALLTRDEAIVHLRKCWLVEAQRG